MENMFVDVYLYIHRCLFIFVFMCGGGLYVHMCLYGNMSVRMPICVHVRMF